MAIVALFRMRGVAVAGVPPPVGCCTPSAPAIQGTAWTGLIIVTIGCAIDWALISSLNYVSNSVGQTDASTLGQAGPSYLAFAFCSIVVACVCFNVVGCCLIGHLPGLGRSSTNCCCGERNPEAPEAPGAPAGAAKSDLAVRAPATAV